MLHAGPGELHTLSGQLAHATPQTSLESSAAQLCIGPTVELSVMTEVFLLFVA